MGEEVARNLVSSPRERKNKTTNQKHGRNGDEHMLRALACDARVGAHVGPRGTFQCSFVSLGMLLL